VRGARKTKLAALLLAGSMALAACASDEPAAGGGSGGGGGGGGGGTEQPRIGLAFDTGGRGDRSFNDAAIAGLDAAVEEHGVEYQELSPNADGSNRADLLTQLADEGYNPIIAVGFAYGEVIGDVVAQYPETQFAIIDSSATEVGADNLTGLLFSEEQGSFLAGVAAATKSETGHIGFVGGVESPLIQKFEAGYVAGAQTVKPDIRIDRQYISPAGDFTGFSAPDRGLLVAQGMYQAGADIVYHAAGGSGVGVFQAAAAAGKRAIGVDSDQYQTVDDPALQAVILTSMLKRVDNAVSAYVDTFIDGSTQGGTDIVYDLEAEGVGLATSGGFIDDIQTTIDDYRQQIVSGQIEVPTTP
jgi:basic membrane protein A